jgi:hypothetical protein
MGERRSKHLVCFDSQRGVRVLALLASHVLNAFSIFPVVRAAVFRACGLACGGDFLFLLRLASHLVQELASGLKCRSADFRIVPLL